MDRMEYVMETLRTLKSIIRYYLYIKIGLGYDRIFLDKIMIFVFGWGNEYPLGFPEGRDERYER